MLSKIKLWLGVALSVLAGLFLYGRAKTKEGKADAKNEQQKEVLNNVQRAKESENNTASKPVDARIERMRKRARGGK